MVKKYEKLVGLYNKKKHRESEELSSRLSHGRTTSHTSGIDNLEPKVIKLVSILQFMYVKRTGPFFTLASCPSVKKFLMTVLVNKMTTFHKRKSFIRIRFAGSNSLDNFFSLLKSVQSRTMRQVFQ